jgi:hypothetical protein
MKTRQRQRITKAVHIVGGREFTIVFKPDGIHVREKYQHAEKVLTLDQLCSGDGATSPRPTKANQSLKAGSPAEALDIAACDLCELAKMVDSKSFDKAAVGDVKKSLARANVIVRSLEILS